MFITNGLTRLQINHLGNIDFFSYKKEKFTQPAYIVFFQEYSRPDPFCRLWDINTPVTDILIGDNWISYTKIIEQIEIKAHIKCHPIGWDWNIEILEDYPLRHRLGITAPFMANNIHHLEGELKTPLAIYSPAFEETYRDQTLINIPIIFGSTQNNFISFFTSSKINTQFFSYPGYIRTTAPTTHNKSITISFRYCNSIDHIKTQYLNKYSFAKSSINHWNKTLESIGKRQRINIILQSETARKEEHQKEITIQPVDKAHIDAILLLIEKELTKYPSLFLSKIRIDGILICNGITVRDFSNLIDKNSNFSASGLAFCAPIRDEIKEPLKWIIWNIGDIIVIHHEIFHFIAAYLNLQLKEEEEYANEFANMMTSRKYTDIIPKEWLLKISSNFCFPFETNTKYEHNIWMIQGEKKTLIPFGHMPIHDCPVDFVT